MQIKDKYKMKRKLNWNSKLMSEWEVTSRTINANNFHSWRQKWKNNYDDNKHELQIGNYWKIYENRTWYRHDSKREIMKEIVNKNNQKI